jgi:hypothetical protein
MLKATNTTKMSYFCCIGIKIAYFSTFFENAICISTNVNTLKGEKMHECEIIELEDFGFNHYIHHIDDLEGDGFGYTNELDFIYDLADYASEMERK